MKTLRIIKKSDGNDSVAVVVCESAFGFTTVTDFVCLMNVTPDSDVGDTMQLNGKKHRLVPSSDEVEEAGSLRFMRLEAKV